MDGVWLCGRIGFARTLVFHSTGSGGAAPGLLALCSCPIARPEPTGSFKSSAAEKILVAPQGRVLGRFAMLLIGFSDRKRMQAATNVMSYGPQEMPFDPLSAVTTTLLRPLHPAHCHTSRLHLLEHTGGPKTRSVEALVSSNLLGVSALSVASFSCRVISTDRERLASTLAPRGLSQYIPHPCV